MSDLRGATEQGYSYCLINIECLPSSSNYNILMDLDEPIEDVFPQLAACLPGCTYIHGAGVMQVMDAGHIIAIHPSRLTITDIGGLDEAAEICRRYYRKICDVRERKDSITPVYEKRPLLSVIEILKLLPRTNCGACDAPSCMAFAAKVFRRECAISKCAPLAEDEEFWNALPEELKNQGA